MPRIEISNSKTFERPLLEMAATRLGWKVGSSDLVTVLWAHGTGLKDDTVQRLRNMRRGSFLSYIPGMGFLTQKVPMADVLQAAGFGFLPRTWSITEGVS